MGTRKIGTRSVRVINRMFALGPGSHPRQNESILYALSLLHVKVGVGMNLMVSSTFEPGEEGPMIKHLCAMLGISVLVAAGAVAQTGSDTRTIQVEINYTGSGTVDARHRIYVALW